VIAPQSVLLITGASPYLGGPQTWAALRAAAPEFRFTEIDVLALADAADISAACRDAVLEGARDADAVVAHNTAAKPVIEALAQMSREVPLLLLSPAIIRRTTPLLEAFRRIIATPLGRATLTSFARSKQRRLSDERNYLKKQMSLLVDEQYISRELLDEAMQRVRDPRCVRAVERTAEVVLDVTAPLDAAVDATVQRRTILVGNSFLDRKTARQMAVTLLPGVRSAPMIEAPAAVADALRAML